MNLATVQHVSLISALMQPDLYDPPVERCELIETHISWVILAGAFAYKIKKPVNLGFLDFSTLEKRRFYCEEELRLNHRLAPAIYLSVLPITGTAEHPQWGDKEGEGDAIEYAVKMKAFPQQAQLDRVLARGELQARQIDILARLIAEFHQRIDVAGADSVYGDPEHIRQPVDENFKQIRDRVNDAEALKPLAELERWSQYNFDALYSIFEQRKSGGYIRECHGDMHLRNIAWADDAPIVFDCIEFNPNLRWIDVISEVAFLVMDLQDRKQPELAQRFLNAYLEHTGDYAGVHVLRFYLIYRALVRAKVDVIRAYQAGISREERTEDEKDFLDYLQLALTYARPAKPQLIITRGMSASGKSTLTQPLLEQLGAIRIRSDVERKRLFGLKPEDNGQSAVGEGIYTTEATHRTYDKLNELAAQIIDAGHSVIVDAVFLKYDEREQFRKLARAKQVPYIILEFTAKAESLRQRIVQRTGGVSDADLTVMEMQRSHWQPLAESERRYAISIDTEVPFDAVLLAGQITARR